MLNKRIIKKAQSLIKTQTLENEIISLVEEYLEAHLSHRNFEDDLDWFDARDEVYEKLFRIIRDRTA